MTHEKSLVDLIENMQSREDLSIFITALLDDFSKNQDTWGNTTLPNFLEAMSAWVTDMDGYYQNKGEKFSENQNWKLLAEILYAAKVYD